MVGRVALGGKPFREIQPARPSVSVVKPLANICHGYGQLPHNGAMCFTIAVILVTDGSSYRSYRIQLYVGDYSLDEINACARVHAPSGDVAKFARVEDMRCGAAERRLASVYRIRRSPITRDCTFGPRRNLGSREGDVATLPFFIRAIQERFLEERQTKSEDWSVVGARYRDRLEISGEPGIRRGLCRGPSADVSLIPKLYDPHMNVLRIQVEAGRADAALRDARCGLSKYSRWRCLINGVVWCDAWRCDRGAAPAPRATGVIRAARYNGIYKAGCTHVSRGASYNGVDGTYNWYSEPDQLNRPPTHHGYAGEIGLAIEESERNMFYRDLNCVNRPKITATTAQPFTNAASSSVTTRPYSYILVDGKLHGTIDMDSSGDEDLFYIDIPSSTYGHNTSTFSEDLPAPQRSSICTPSQVVVAIDDLSNNMQAPVIQPMLRLVTEECYPYLDVHERRDQCKIASVSTTSPTPPNDQVERASRTAHWMDRSAVDQATNGLIIVTSQATHGRRIYNIFEGNGTTASPVYLQDELYVQPYSGEHPTVSRNCTGRAGFAKCASAHDDPKASPFDTYEISMRHTSQA
ncbi:hypothetical protein BV25DRAFT_1838602 [Artomyces pyxidatus]|uniref:Uncharacterized protein n=1 Tax=Artomyces pyxidatus TaxID=48021 RepID=A0ACB8T1S4_9AGAM|nr:hypothetical protein BV25DRAFT_1838602 [Artomyces pyxidatus]